MDALGYHVATNPNDVYWKSPVNGTAGTGSNWVGGTAPSTSQTAQFNLVGNAYTVSLSGNENTGGLYVHANNVTANLSGHTWTLQQTAVNEDAFIVGQAANENGTLSLTNGTLTVNETNGNVSSIAQQANSTGYLFVNSGATLNNNGALYIGENGSGEIQCLGGTTNITGGFDMGVNAGSLGRAALDSGAFLNTTSVEEHIGNYGDAYFYQNGGTHNCSNNLLIAVGGSSTGYYALSGGALNVSGYEFVNYNSTGSGTLNQTGGSAWVGVGLVVGTHGGQGTYTLAPTTANAYNTTLTVAGNETIGGAAATNGVPSGVFNQYAFSYNSVGYASEGTPGSPATLYVGSYGSGVYNLYGGDVQVNGTLSIATGAGSVGFFNESTQTSYGDVYATNEIVGDSGNGSMLVNGQAAEDIVSGNLTVGNSGIGILTVDNGGYVEADGPLMVGNAAGASGQIIMTSASGNVLTTPTEYIGYSGTGQFNQAGGSNDTNELFVGGNGTGTYILTGGALNVQANSGYTGNEIVYGGGAINQSGGVNSTVSLSISAGSTSSPAYLLSGNGNLSAGSLSLNSGLFVMSGSSTLNCTGAEYIDLYASGSAGTAIFNQTGGTHTVGGTLYINEEYTPIQVRPALKPPLGGPTQAIYGITGGSLYAASCIINYNQEGAAASPTIGELVVGGNASVTIAGTLTAYNIGNTAISLGGGYLAVGDINTEGAPSSFSWTGGELEVTGSQGLTISPTSTEFGASAAIGTSQYLVVDNTLAINGGGSFSISGGGNVSAGSIFMTGGQVVMSGNSILNCLSSENIGNGSTTPAIFNQSGGTHNVSGPMFLGRTAGSTGEYILSAGNLNVAIVGPNYSNGEVIGSGGSGTFIQSGGTNEIGTSAVTQSLAVGFGQGGVGTYTLNSSAATLIVTGNVALGGSDTAAGGVGVMNITGGNASIGGTLRIWNTAGSGANMSGGTLSVPTLTSDGTFNQSGGTLSSTTETVGNNAVGSLALSGSAKHTVNYLAIGGNAGSNGTYTQSGGNLTVNNQVYVGLSGTGTFNQTGGTVSAGDFFVGYNGGSVGTATVGNGATLNASNAYVGGNNVGTAQGTGTLNINGGNMTVSGPLTLYNTAGTALNLSSGNLSIGSLVTSNGSASRLNWTGGALNITGNQGLTIGSGGPLGSAINLTAGQGLGVTNTLTNNGSLTVNGGSLSFGTFSGNAISWVSGTFAGGTYTIGSGQTFGSGGGTVTVSGTATLDLNGAIVLGTVNDGSGGNVIATGNTVCTGTFNLNAGGTLTAAAATVTFVNLMQNGGTYNSDPTTTDFSAGFNNLTTGVVTGRTGDVFNLENGSAFNNAGTFTNPATLSANAVTNSGTFNQTGTLAETGNFVNTGNTTLGGVQHWSAVTFTNTAGNSVFKTDSGSSSASPLTVADNGGSVIFGSSQHLAALSIASGASAFVTAISPASNRSLLTLGSLSITGSTNYWNGKLDLADNDLDIVNGNLATVTNQIGTGYAKGAWTGNGITSSSAAGDSTHLTALGVIENSSNGITPLYGSGAALGLFDGASPGATDVLVRYTYYGDANLDGRVDGMDYTRIDYGSLNHLTGWYNGDFNYDGVVNGSDYTLIDNSFNTQGASLSAEVADAAPTDQIAGSAGGTSVPEPASLGLIGMAAAGLLGRRNPRRY
jgi:T5SS/PEP-CTERM-associated repeat protein